MPRAFERGGREREGLSTATTRRYVSRLTFNPNIVRTSHMVYETLLRQILNLTKIRITHWGASKRPTMTRDRAVGRPAARPSSKPGFWNVGLTFMLMQHWLQAAEHKLLGASKLRLALWTVRNGPLSLDHDALLTGKCSSRRCSPDVESQRELRIPRPPADGSQ